MKNLLIASAALAALAAPAAAFAIEVPADVSGDVTINGSVAAACVIADGADINLGELADTDGLYNLAADSKTSTLTAWCNGSSSTMAVEATAITLQSGPSPVTGFTDTVNYKATASVTPADAGSPVSVADTSDGAADAAVTVGLFADDITVTLSDSSTDGNKLIAGTYKGSVTVTLSPAV